METTLLRAILIAFLSFNVLILLINLLAKKLFLKRSKLSFTLYYLLFTSLGLLLFFELSNGVLLSDTGFNRSLLALIIYLISIPVWLIDIELSFICKKSFKNIYFVCGTISILLILSCYLMINNHLLGSLIVKGFAHILGVLCYCYYLLNIIGHWLKTKRSSFENEELLFLFTGTIIFYSGYIFSLTLREEVSSMVVMLSLYLCFSAICFYKIQSNRIPFTKRDEDELNIFMPTTLFSGMEYDKDDPFEQIKNQLIEYFDKSRPYLKEDLKIEEVALALMTNKTYLSRTLNMKMNVNFNQFVNYFRVKESMQLYLKDRNVSVKEMCVRSGFRNVASFTQAFKINTGCTPAEWCREIKNS